MWEILGIAPGADRDAIRRGYARKLRITNPEDDAEAFKQLRAAYERALAHADHAAVWAVENDADDEVPGEDGYRREIPLPPDGSAQPADESFDREEASSVSEPQFRTESASGQQSLAGVADLLAEREGDIARLNARLDTLQAALRGPWHGDERAVAETFASILRSPAMGEIRVRADVELWVAGLLAATIPRSDVILAEAVTAFGWGDERRGTAGAAIDALLARIDEWRIIERFNRHGHPLHPAWKSITRPAGAWWSWRLDAFRPGVESGIATLLGAHGAISPGLEYSFKADSVERWRRFLGKPHWTLGMLAAIPLVLLLALAMGDAFGETAAANRPWADWAIGAGALLSPVVPFFARMLRARWLRSCHPAWLAKGWPVGIALVLLAAVVLPSSVAALTAITAATALVWLWMAVAGGSATIEEVRARLRASWLAVIGCTFVGIGAAVTLDPVHRAALALMLALGVTVMVGPLSQGASLLTRVRWWRAAYAVAVVAAFGAVAFGVALFAPGPAADLFYAGGLTLVGGLIVTAAAGIAGVRSNAEHQTLRFLRMAIVGVFLFGAIVAIGDEPASSDPVTVPVTTQPTADTSDTATSRRS